MIIAILGLIFSLIAVLISLCTYFFNKKVQEQNKFENFINKFYKDVEEFIYKTSTLSINANKYDFVTIVLDRIRDGYKDFKYDNCYNEIMKQYNCIQDNLKFNYMKLNSEINTIFNKKTKLYIEWLNNLINELYVRVLHCYIAIIYLYDNHVKFFRDIISEEEYYKYVDDIYDGLQKVNMLNNILSRYIFTMNDFTNQMSLEVELFNNIKLSKFKNLFKQMDIMVKKWGVNNYLNDFNNDEIKDNYLKEAVKNGVAIKKEMIEFKEELRFTKKIYKGEKYEKSHNI